MQQLSIPAWIYHLGGIFLFLLIKQKNSKRISKNATELVSNVKEMSRSLKEKSSYINFKLQNPEEQYLSQENKDDICSSVFWFSVNKDKFLMCGLNEIRESFYNCCQNGSVGLEGKYLPYGKVFYNCSQQEKVKLA